MYNHAFDIAFEVVTDKRNPSDVPVQDLVTALRKRIESLLAEGESNFKEAVDCFDTHKET